MTAEDHAALVRAVLVGRAALAMLADQPIALARLDRAAATLAGVQFDLGAALDAAQAVLATHYGPLAMRPPGGYFVSIFVSRRNPLRNEHEKPEVLPPWLHPPRP